MSEFPWTELATAGATALLMWGAGWIRTLLARNVAVSTPVERRVNKLRSTVRRMAFLQEAMADRQAMQSQAIILMANGVKLGDQTQVDRAMDVMNACESQYLASLTAHLNAEDNEDEEEE